MTSYSDEEDPKVADYFVVAGLTEGRNPRDVELNFPGATLQVNQPAKDPIIDICLIDKTMEESCPQGFTCIETTPSGFSADLNHGSFTAHSLFICYRRGRDKPPLIDLGVYYEGLETVKNGVTVITTTAAGKSGNVNNRSGMGSFPIYVTFRRADPSSPQSTLVVTDICVILTNKNEVSPYAYCQINKNLNKGMIGSSVFLCYKKSMRQVNSVTFRPDLLGRYPATNIPSFPLPPSVPLFCLPMGSPIECWTSKTKHPLPSFSSFVLTTEKSDKVYGAVVSFYEPYPENLLQNEHKYTLGLLRADGKRSQGDKSLHTVKAICLLSRWPLFDAFRDFLIFIYRLTVSPIKHAVPIERHIAHFIHRVPFPSPERPRVQYQMSPMHATVLTRPQITPIPVSGASFLSLLDDFGADNTLTVITLALLEYKILIHSLRRFEITRVAEALISLLFPFKWQCTYVPLCPLEMAYVLEAPTPFIVGLDSRYFDICEPPADVVCVNLDTNTVTQVGKEKITWKILPKKPAKLARTILHSLFTEIKQCNLRVKEDEGEYSGLNPSMSQTAMHIQIEVKIQETLLKFMAVLMNGYRDHLLPLTEAPSVGTTDPGSLFDIHGFIHKQDKPSQRFYSMLMSTQLFAAFIESRSFASFSGSSVGESTGKAASLVFFDECIDRLRGEYVDNVKLIDSEDTLSSERTIIILPPDEKATPTNEGYSYTTFPQLQEELFSLTDDDTNENALDSDSSRISQKRRRSTTFVIGKRTKQELKVSLKQAKRCCRDAIMWSKLLLSNAYCVWFGCLLDYSRRYHSKISILKYGLDVLQLLKNAECIPLPDETSYRILMHLCCLYNKPVLAMKVFQFLRDHGTQLSAVTYGLYNKALLECEWPSSDRDGYMLWQKLRNVFNATVYLRKLVRKRQKNGSISENSDLRSDSSSTRSVEQTRTQQDTWSSKPNNLDQYKDLATPLPDEKQSLEHRGDGDGPSSNMVVAKSGESLQLSDSAQDTTSNLSEVSGVESSGATQDEEVNELPRIPRKQSNIIVKPHKLPEEEDGGGDGTTNTTDGYRRMSKKSVGKLVIERKDITDLALDPLSPTINVEVALNNFPPLDGNRGTDNTNLETKSQETLSQTNEMEYLAERFSSLNDVSVGKPEADETKVNSLTSTPANTAKKAGLLKRSFSFAPDSSFSENIWSSGSKFNSLLKATTIGVASKAKRLATNLAKDINQTVQTNLSYYTPEKFKGSLGSLSEIGHDGQSNDTRLKRDDRDYSGSQSSLQSYNEKYSSRSTGSSKMNPAAFGNTLNSPRPILAMSSTSLNSRAAVEMEVIMSSCSRCTRCRCIVYDEEIMAGWMADESNLNTHCPFCNQLFVPHLNIRLLSVHELDPVTVPYLSPLVLRKELESLLENEGMAILGEPAFVDNHHIVYWNFVWYFRRLNLQSNLYNLILDSKHMSNHEKSQKEQIAESKKSGDRVSVLTKWDNLLMQKDMVKPPLYMAYLQSRSNESHSMNNYSFELFEKIESCIMHDDVTTPILLLLDEYSSENGGRLPRRGVYREILFFIIASLGKDSIDIDAFDQAYRKAYNDLTVLELEKTANCDKPPSQHASECRVMFGELDFT